MKKELIEILEKIKSSSFYQNQNENIIKLNEATQKNICNILIEKMNLPKTRSRLDVSTHPFTTSMGNDDVRITTNFERQSPLFSFFSTIHEAGHALIAALLPEADPIHKVTIIPRGLALGTTQQLPLDDRYTYSKEYLEAQLSVLMAGRASEKMLLDKTADGLLISSGIDVKEGQGMASRWRFLQFGFTQGYDGFRGEGVVVPEDNTGDHLAYSHGGFTRCVGKGDNHNILVHVSEEICGKDHVAPVVGDELGVAGRIKNRPAVAVERGGSFVLGNVGFVIGGLCFI